MKTWIKWSAPCLIVLLAAMIGFELGQRFAENATTSARNDLLLSERERVAARAANLRLKAENAALAEATAEPEPAVVAVPEPSPGLETVGRLKQLQQMNVTVRITPVQRGGTI